MADFLESEAEESDQSEEEDLEPHERKKLKKIKAMSDSSEEEEEDDEERLREEMNDLIDDNPIEDEESDGGDSDRSGGPSKRKKSDEEDEMSDRLEDEDYDLIEENLGVKVERKRFKRLKRLEDEESDNETQDSGMNREQIAGQLFEGSDEEREPEKEEERRSERSAQRREADVDLQNFDEEEEEESDADDFIVDDDGVPLTEKRKKRKPMFADASLQEGQDIFGVDFDYEEFDKYGEDEEYESEAESEYEEEEIDGERERRPKKTARKRITKKSIFEIYEPSELKRGHFTDLDNEIRKTDIPERMQLREVKITPVPEESNELDFEAEWIYKHAFCKATVSNQDSPSGDSWGGSTRKPPSTVGKIKQALDFMRNQQLEVPFIAFYRKEYVTPELKINDLWTVYKYDARWCLLAQRKAKLTDLFEKMRSFQVDKITTSGGETPTDIRFVKDEDLDRLRAVQTPEELKDVHNHFLLYYAHEIPEMQQWSKRKAHEERRLLRIEARRRAMDNLEEGAELPPEIADEPEEDDEPRPEEQVNRKMDSGPYAMCRKAGIGALAKRFGLAPEQFAENLRDNYQRHEVEQEPIEPAELAKEFVSPKFPTVEDVLYAAKFMVARQISREPLLRKTVREVYYERAKLSIRPTKQGMKEVDENHPCFTMKYLANKPVRDLKADQFLKLSMAEEHKLLEISISEKIDTNSTTAYLEEAKSLYNRDEFSKHVQDWNALRSECVELALTKMVLPDLRKELSSILLNEAKDAVLKACCRKLYQWIKVAPYSVSFDEEDYEWETAKGVRVMGVAYVPDYSQAAFAAIVSPDGEVTDFLRLPHILRRKNAYREDERQLKETDLEAVTNFIRNKKPHVIVVGGESREAMMIADDLRGCVKQLVEEESFPQVSVEITDNELAKIYANSNKGTADFREYPLLLRQAVSLARKLQDPLYEYSQLCTADEEILCLRYHTLQDQLNKEELLEALYVEFINRTNEVGVDVNLAVLNPLTVNLVQFICGLGPRKGAALVKILKQTNQRLENRTQLVTACHMGPKVFINCSGFIKIDTNSLGDSTEAYVEVLDGSRVHPETYEWARKMAVDALEYDDEDANPAGALEEILESPERLKDLDLDAFAVELERQGFGNKSITLYDIRAELNSRYKDLRTPYQPLSPEELFDVLTKETPETFYVGKLVLSTVIGYSHKKPQGDQLDQANPVRNEETGLWQCPFCLKNDFPELSEVWTHFDAGGCPGQATGVKLRLDNGLSGFIHIKNLSDSHVKNPEERVQVGQTIHCRIMKIDVQRFSVDCTSKTSDLADRNNEWRPRKDPFYDQDTEDRDLKKESDLKKQKDRQAYTKRVIAHPQFHNKSYAEVLKLMADKDQGEVIVRPSSKGTDHLTVTWKVAPDVFQHIDVREEGKENEFSLGRSLLIGNEEFEDLDEIIARHVNQMAAHARDLLDFKYYRDTAGGMKDKAEELLKEEKRKNPNKIHYIFSASKKAPGSFLLSYLPSRKFRHEYVTVTPDGFRYRQQMFDSINSLLKWFKEHYKDPIPGTPAGSTPRGGQSATSRTPYGGGATGGSTVNSEALKRQQVPTNAMFNSLAATSQTPHYPHTPGTYGGASTYINTPYTPSGQTPFMTPYHTPHSSQTPRYGQTTPSQAAAMAAAAANGPFLHPGVPISTQRVYQQSPYAGSPRFQPSPSSRAYSTGAAPSTQHQTSPWAQGAPPQQRPMAGASGPPRHIGTPRGGNQRTPRFDDYRRTPQQPFNRSHSRGGYNTPNNNSMMPTKSPRSIRSTPRSNTSPKSMTFVSSPKTNTSPKSMMMGDETPLWDED